MSEQPSEAHNAVLVSARCTAVMRSDGKLCCETHDSEEWQIVESLGGITHCKIKHTSQFRARYLAALSPDSLRQLADTVQDRSTLAAIAITTKCPATTLSALATHRASEVRAAVAHNSNTPTSILIRLLDDRSTRVRYRAHMNTALPVGELRKAALAGDRFWESIGWMQGVQRRAIEIFLHDPEVMAVALARSAPDSRRRTFHYALSRDDVPTEYWVAYAQQLHTLSSGDDSYSIPSFLLHVRLAPPKEVRKTLARFIVERTQDNSVVPPRPNKKAGFMGIPEMSRWPTWVQRACEQ